MTQPLPLTETRNPDTADIDAGGRVKIELSVTVTISLLFFDISKTAYFTIGYLQFFEEPFVMTRGGPLNSTISASMYTYQQFGFGNYGLAGAMAYMTFIVILIVTLVQFRLTRERD